MSKPINDPAPQGQPPVLLEILSREPFAGLKAILLGLGSEPGLLEAAIESTGSCEALFQRVGYRVALTNQIHIQDCYSRVGAKGGIKAVLPYYDIPTGSSFPTLINFDSTVTTTPKAVAFFDKLLAALKIELVRCKNLASQGRDLAVTQ
jgi:hypothetical protein